MEKVLLPPLHIKLGIVKNFIKALVKRNNERAFQRLQQIFRRLSKAKIKEGVLNGPDIRKLMKDDQFEQCLLEEEGVAWDNLKAVIEGALDKLEMQESDEHGERFHQVTAQLEHWYSGKKQNLLLADLCWNLQMKSDDEDDN
ncbi:uncharacterized protein LOC116349837 [Contarinia nasturtii]|uniref:uncharacterized protein LOC116349837 n=1 Tax=Contarinia nasturtii TaxID=265458 RepID=UPI0012D467FB|nr:uncharacterized protein LOC116349837 [Contarinia nasturtii]